MQIQIKNLSFSFENVNDNTIIEVFKNLNATFDAEKITCVVGHSGSGKTTLIRLLIGLEKYSVGEIIKSQNIKLGMVFQEDRLLPWLNMSENIIFGLKEYEKEKLSSIISFMGLNGFEKAYPHTLSGGMRQRVALARTLIRDANMLLLDEPFSALDAFTRKKMQNEIVRIKNELKIGMVFVTHSIEEALNIADEIVVIKDKKTISTMEDKNLWKQIEFVL